MRRPTIISNIHWISFKSSKNVKILMGKLSNCILYKNINKVMIF